MGPQGKDRLAAWALGLACALPLGVFAWMLGEVLWLGLPQWSLAYFLEPVSQAGREGGIGPVIVSTLALLGLSMAVAVPLGLGTALLLSEHLSKGQPLARALRGSLELLAAVPSIIFGLFGMAFFSQTLRLGWSIAAGSLTLACMILPIFIRVAEESLSSVPSDYRRAAQVLGIGRVRLAFKVLIPAALPGLFAGLVLGLGRALAETAAVMFTAGASVHMPRTWFDSGRSLAYHVYILSIEVPGGTPRAPG